MENGTYTPKHEVIDIGELCRKAGEFLITILFCI